MLQSQRGLSESSSFRSDCSRDSQMGGLTSREVPKKALKTKLAQGGGTSGSSSLASDGSCDGLAGDWTPFTVTVAKRAQGESWKTTPGSQET